MKALITITMSLALITTSNAQEKVQVLQQKLVVKEIQYQTAKSERDSLLITNNDLNKFIAQRNNALLKTTRLLQEMYNENKDIDFSKLIALGWDVAIDSTATKPDNKLPE